MSSIDSALDFTAVPSGRRARTLHQHLRTRIGESTSALLHSAERGLGSDYTDLIDRVSNLDDSRAFSPGVFVAYFALLDALSHNNAIAAHAAVASLDALGDWHSGGLTVATVGATDWETPILERLRSHPVADRFGRMTVIDPLPGQDLEGYQSDIAEALELIAAADPQMRAEVDEYVRHVCVSRGSGITGATSLQFFGAVFLREPYPEYHRVMYFFEHLVHETSHLNLNIVQTIDPLVLNAPDELHQSPLRRDPRPVMGICH